MNVFVGTSGYSFKEWKGSFYPEDLPDKQMLHYYAERFRTVEINNTFYRMPSESVLKNWAGEVSAGFAFVLKAPQRITHKQRLKESADSVAYLFKVAAALEDRLGPVLFQLPPFLRKDLPRLGDFLKILPAGRRVAFEFRHASWFDDEVYDALRGHGAALCIAEAEDDLEVPFVATAPWGYIRLRRPDYGDRELTAWDRRIREQNWQDVFVFFKHEDAGAGPKLAARFVELSGR
jgi:uncharacterized protein YecE (DUF72 family)